ncbi:hypothetical protein THRCLA_01115 [Thraustotheca clavata]|uniref:Secreted protein n=1 Tax=Thraustotheca clavata TaxID=74557 RepID=A0A0A7CLN3_9STRA|nr:secreted protein [Thraustotheca clavata]OQS06859.1 hypothetical protein THRCLA_01115 [Thraustotheca clavata]
MVRSYIGITAWITAVVAVEFRFTNHCNYTINLFGGGNVPICELRPHTTRNNNCNATLGTQGLFKHNATNEANLLEYSLINTPGFNQVWYDISNIPPGPGDCKSFEHCKAVTNKTGFNVPMHVAPTKYANGANCRVLNVTKEDSEDAYLFPSDDLKTHDCPLDEVFNVTFCHPGLNNTISLRGLY